MEKSSEITNFFMKKFTILKIMISDYPIEAFPPVTEGRLGE